MTVFSEHLSEKELLAQLEEMSNLVEIGSLYAHYRDLKTPYKVVGLSILEATEEVAVIYQKQLSSLQSVQWVRPISSWLEKVKDERGVEVRRFQKI